LEQQWRRSEHPTPHHISLSDDGLGLKSSRTGSLGTPCGLSALLVTPPPYYVCVSQGMDACIGDAVLGKQWRAIYCLGALPSDCLSSHDAAYINDILIQLYEGTPLERVYANGSPVRIYIKRRGALEEYADLVPHSKECTDAVLVRPLILFLAPHALVIWLRELANPEGCRSQKR